MYTYIDSAKVFYVWKPECRASPQCTSILYQSIWLLFWKNLIWMWTKYQHQYKHRSNCDSYWLSPHGTGNPSLLYVSHVFPVSINQYVAFAFILRKTIEIYQIKQKSIMLDNFILFSGSFLSSFYQKIWRADRDKRTIELPKLPTRQ